MTSGVNLFLRLEINNIIEVVRRWVSIFFKFRAAFGRQAKVIHAITTRFGGDSIIFSAFLFTFISEEGLFCTFETVEHFFSDMHPAYFMA
jgi:hypothetical protein